MSAVHSYTVRAHNYALESENKIHSDATASRYGFKGGLVPGVADMAYLARAVYDVWGEPWLRGGALRVKLFKPVYDGERATARVQPNADNSEAELLLVNEADEPCATGAAVLAGRGEAPRPEDFPRIEGVKREARPAPTTKTFPADHLLGAYEYDFDARAAHAEAVEMFVEPWPGNTWHPALLLHDANLALRTNVALGPWIHTASDMQLFDAPRDGERISLRGSVLDTYEKRGHIMTDIKLGVFSGERPIAHIRHSAIIQLSGS